MTADNLSQRVSELSQRLEELQAKCKSNPADAPEILSNALESLNAYIEDLSVAKNVIKRQKEECIESAEERADALKLAHELQVHKIELEMQNAELQHQNEKLNKLHEKLEKERAFTSNILDNMSSLLVVLDKDGYITCFNHACEQLTGYSFEDVKGKAFWEILLIPEELDRIIAGFKDFLAGKYPNTFENYWVTRHGDKKLISWFNNAIVGADGSVEYIICSGIDITEPKRIEDDLKRSESKYRSIVEQSRDGIVLADESGYMIEWNPGVEAIIGLKRDKVLGRYLWDVKFELAIDERRTPEVYENLKAIAMNVLKTGRSPLMDKLGELTIQRPDGTRTTIEEMPSTIATEKGYMICGIVRDITDRKKIEEELRRSKDVLELRVQERTVELSQAKENLETINKKLQIEISEHEMIEKELTATKDVVEAALRAKSEFLMVMSHELRTPLNGILGMSSLLAMDNLSSGQQESVEVIRSCGESLLAVINDILNFTKIENGMIGLENRPFNLRGCINDTVRLISPKSKAKGLDIACSIDRTIPEAIIADQMRLRQVLLNLLDNAIKFTDAGRIDVSVSGRSIENDRQEILFSIKDTGIGISENGRSKLFQPFSQVDMSTTRKYGGTGLGLAISKELVELMGGKIWVESETGRGSTFYFTMVTNQPQDMLTYNFKPALKDTLKVCPAMNCRVLLAEDNDINRVVTLRMLKRLGYTADAVASGREAIESLQRQHYDIVLMDVQMSDIDGLAAARLIRNLWPESCLKIIALTAHALQGDREKCIEAGMDDYIAKPVEMGGLAEALSRYTL